MRTALDETNRRREIQLAYNVEHNITPQTIRKAITVTLTDEASARRVAREAIHASQTEFDQTELIAELEREMLATAKALEFEQAARIRDQIAELKGEDTPAKQDAGRRTGA